MQFYDSSQKRAICQEIDRLCDSDDTSYPRLDKTARVNDALEVVEGWIMLSDGTWNFDDENYSNLPINTYTLVEGQTSYAIADKFLEIDEINVLDTNGMWQPLTPFDPYELRSSTVEQYFGITASSTPKGLPTHYDKQANNLKLYPAPAAASVTLTLGLRIRHKRTASLFTPVSTTDADTTVPGFPSPYHIILAYMASLPYCMSFKKDRVALYEKKIGDTYPYPTGLKKGLLDLMGHREQDVRKVLTMAKIQFR